MGIYLNPGNETFADIVEYDIYVDKTELIGYMNQRIGKAKHLIASSRPRRFGKTLAAAMLTAYYSRGCASREIFQNLKIAQDESFARHLNKYDVISLDIQWMRSVVLGKKQMGEEITILGYIQQEVLRELREEFSEYVDESENSIAAALARINQKTKRQFIIIIDEWDCIFREEKENTRLQEEYIIFLRSLFKGIAADEFVKLAYITGILPIKKYGTESALNNFDEFTMVDPFDLAEYIGFTEKEVKMLCERANLSFKKMQKWYDGYVFQTEEELGEEDDIFLFENEKAIVQEKDTMLHVYSPNSVMEAISKRRFRNYWSQTETYESLKVYIEMDFDGLKQKIVDMLGGDRCRIIPQSFQNDMTTFKSASDVLTLLVHLGYLTYDSVSEEVFIPNEEVRDAFVLAVTGSGWDDVYKAIRQSEKLLKATLAMDEDAVAKILQDVHMENSSSLVYNNEVSLASIIRVAYYTAIRSYTIVRELPSGEGFADVVFLPKRNAAAPALLVELKWDKSAEGAIDQIRDKKYVSALKDYTGNLLLVGINYDKKSKKHQCKIEKFQKER